MEGGGVDSNGDSLMMGIDMMMMLPPPLPNHPNINNPLLALMNTATTHHTSLPPPHPHPHPHHSSNAGMINTLFHPHSSSSSNHNNNYQLNHNTSSSTTPYPHHLMMFGNNNTNNTNTNINNNNNNNDNNNNSITIAAPGCYFTNNNNTNNTNNNNMTAGSSSSSSFSFRDKIMAHPHYPRLLSAYISCQKVGAPPDVVERLERIYATQQAALLSCMSKRGCLGEDPALDQFMEAYCEMLTKYEQELTKPFQEAMLFFSSIESQLKGLTIASSSTDSAGLNGSSEEELEPTDGFIDPRVEDRELKVKLLRKYSGYLGSLKQEFMKKRKKGKLPKNARQQLLDWWSRHYKWPYPSESQKLALAESTGLDQKQINNWFINQRKRHWKPSEEMQFMVMDTMHHPQYYIDNVMMNNPFPIDYCPQPSLL